jgi:hypothetical protein
VPTSARQLADERLGPLDLFLGELAALSSVSERRMQLDDDVIDELLGRVHPRAH